MENPTTVKMPKAEPVKEQRHDFTPAQLETIQEQLKIRADAERFIGMFMTYVQKEAKLPITEGGWTLAMDAEGKPYMKAIVPEKR